MKSASFKPKRQEHVLGSSKGVYVDKCDVCRAQTGWGNIEILLSYLEDRKKDLKGLL